MSMFRPLRRHNVALAASSAQNHHPAAESIAIANDAQQNKLVELAIAVRSAPAVDGVRSVRCDQRYHSPYFSEWTKRIYGLVKPRKKLSAEPIQMMSTKDPLSVPIMFVNFRRFVSCVGLMFWLQDQFEEIVMWKEGWRVTCAWLSAYGFYCYFPQLFQSSSQHIHHVQQPPPADGSIPCRESKTLGAHFPTSWIS